MTQLLAGRRILITGAAGGFGRVLTRVFAEAGADVVATDVASNGLAALADELKSESLADKVTIRTLDISDRAACDRCIADSDSIDILINNGAMSMSIISPYVMTELVQIEDIDPDLWDKFIAVNLTGAWNLTRAVVPAMKAHQWGRIINVTTSMFTMLRGRFHPYGPAKAGLEAMSAGHAQEFEPFGITVNVVVPGGPADTPMVPQESGYDRASLVPASAMAPPMLWLCTDEAADVTGNRYIAAEWDTSKSIADNRAAAEAPTGWPGLAESPVWPGGKPDE